MCDEHCTDLRSRATVILSGDYVLALRLVRELQILFEIAFTIRSFRKQQGSSSLLVPASCYDFRSHRVGDSNGISDMGYHELDCKSRAFSTVDFRWPLKLARHHGRFWIFHPEYLAASSNQECLVLWEYRFTVRSLSSFARSRSALTYRIPRLRTGIPSSVTDIVVLILTVSKIFPIWSAPAKSRLSWVLLRDEILVGSLIRTWLCQRIADTV
jgi:hypothetical protein